MNVLEVSPVAKDRVSVLVIKSEVMTLSDIPIEVATVTD